ncbi:MAG: hypothetical protein N2318_09565 [Meiothermus sp.]|nr:hypothetical protein [Meiothermus sp.]
MSRQRMLEHEIEPISWNELAEFDRWFTEFMAQRRNGQTWADAIHIWAELIQP